MEPVIHSGRLMSLRLGLVIGLSMGLPLPAQAADEPMEYQVKAAFLLNFTKFIEWPASAFAAPDSPIAICVLGDDPFGSVLDQIVAGEVVNGRRVSAQKIKRAPAPKACQILFVSRREKDVLATLSALGPGVLTIGEGESFLRDGGMIAFVVENRRVRFDINETAAEHAGLKLSSKLLTVAVAVGNAYLSRQTDKAKVDDHHTGDHHNGHDAGRPRHHCIRLNPLPWTFGTRPKRLAAIIADNSTAALAFDDPKSAADTLSASRARTHLVAACIFRLDGTMLADYSRPGAPSGCPPPDSKDGIRFGDKAVTVSRAIMLSGRRIGALVLLYDLAEISERMRIYGFTVLGVLLVSNLVAFLLSSSLRAVIATPISQLVHAMTSVSETSDYGIRAKKISDDELGVLVDRFNEMLAGIQSRDNDLRTALHEREQALRDAESARERFHFMAESMPQKIFTATPSGEVDYFNRQWTDFTGLPVEQILKWGWTQFIHPDDVDANVRTWRHSIDSGEPFHFQHRFRRADGEYRWHLSRAHSMRDAQGKITMWIGSNTDIHEQKEKEEELRRANDDLQQFAYSASHDLQEPIRNVAVYSEVVAKRYHNLLDADGQQFLGFLTEGGRRLATLINDLLAYTRAGVVEQNTAGVDSSAVLKHTLASLAQAIRESGATVTCDALPVVQMGESHLQQVFQNLIGNALKYRKEDAPRIHISAIQLGSAWRFSVQDNGIGIDSQYKEKIFGVFKRLHRDQKYDGTGIGLAICQRVVERYGGRIWVESEPGQGATFFFTVPQLAARVRPATVDSSVG